MKKCMKYLALLGLSASMAFAHETINKFGQLGFDKTYSGQAMKHGQLAISLLADISNDASVFNEEMLLYTNVGLDQPKNYIAGSGYFSMSFGLFEILDIAVMIPFYYDKMEFELGDASDQGYLGNLRASLKFHAPLPEDQVFDVSLILGGDFPTTDASKRGVWVREPDYFNLAQHNGYAYGSNQSIFRTTLAATIDLRKVDAAPLLFHLNGGYRFTLQNDDYAGFYTFAVGAELYPLSVVSIFAEYYMDIVDGDYVLLQDLSVNEASVGLVFHIGRHLDLQLGGHFAVSKKYTSLPITGGFAHDGTKEIGDQPWSYKARTIPSAYGFGGITWSGFLISPDRDGDGVDDDQDKCPDEPGDPRNDGCPWPNPDLDEDGICDPWVAERGLTGYFDDICEGIDQCPNEAGEGDDGCPLDNPDTDGDGVCDAWVAQKNMSKRFKDVCSGIDNCPGQPGTAENMGCPEDNPDADGDGICDPWVSQKNKLAQFSNVCQGYDECPGEAGPKANKGCPWPDPDTDGDGLCDPWVLEKKMSYFFENAESQNDPYITKSCKGIDKCPYEPGPAFNDGCPMDNPDSDGDGVCDPWVSQKKLLDNEEIKEICSGVDKCPLDSGSVDNDGCPMDNPDSDGDGVCDPWVSEKKMLDKVKNVCTGFDKCPYDAGDPDNNGCPMDNPDTDNDGVCDPWVAQKGLSEKFKDRCVGVDKCPLDPGPPDNNGCEVKLKPIKLDGVVFASGKAVLNGNAKKALKSTVRELKLPENEGTKIVIEGHTDNVGKEAKNQKLSLQRAEAVMKYLISQGIKKDRVQAIGCGSTAPVASNKTADGREENRRIEMHPVTSEEMEHCVAQYTED